MSDQRWDVVLKILDGPLASSDEHVHRGPVVRIGADPGPGGFRLDGYRGLDGRHATITAYDGGSATCAPIGTNQVRMAPHSNVSWKDIDPMGGPEYLSEGCCLHLGPVGRGVTLEFVQCRKLGVWSTGALSSEYTGGPTPVPGGGVVGPGAPPAAYNARRTRQITASSVPAWFIGCMVLLTAVFVTVPLAVVGIRAISIERLGPIDDGEDFYTFATIPTSEINPKLKEGLDQPFYDFVMKYNIEESGKTRLSDPTNWDTEFYDKVAASLQTHIAAWNVFKRLDVVREDYAEVLDIMRKADLPDVFAGIPYLESRYNPDMQSEVCAKGYWQFMPEVAFRVGRDSDVTFRVQDCAFKDGSFIYNPDAPTPPVNVRKNGKYMDPETHTCRIKACRVDDRMHITKSSEAAAFTLTEAWEDEALAGSGALVQIVILSHNAGYDDSRFGVRKKSNMRDAFYAWSKGRDEDEHPTFYGENITTADPKSETWNGSVIPPEAQHYAYTIVAEHLLAVCYYGQNYSDSIKAFKDYRQYTQGDGYCNELNIPTSSEVQKHKGKSK